MCMFTFLFVVLLLFYCLRLTYLLTYSAAMLVTAEQGKKKGSKTVSTAEQLTVKTDRVITG